MDRSVEPFAAAPLGRNTQVMVVFFPLFLFSFFSFSSSPFYFADQAQRCLVGVSSRDDGPDVEGLRTLAGAFFPLFFFPPPPPSPPPDERRRH